jgi:hypothetical protein
LVDDIIDDAAGLPTNPGGMDVAQDLVYEEILLIIGCTDRITMLPMGKG